MCIIESIAEKDEQAWEDDQTDTLNGGRCNIKAEKRPAWLHGRWSGSKGSPGHFVLPRTHSMFTGTG